MQVLSPDQLAAVSGGISRKLKFIIQTKKFFGLFPPRPYRGKPLWVEAFEANHIPIPKDLWPPKRPMQ